jgi:hypothetical protein
VNENASPTTDTRPPLIASDVLALAAVVFAAMDGARVAWVPGGDASAARYGVARHVVTDENASLPTGREDIRDGYLRVTLDLGGIGDQFWPVSKLVQAYKTGEFRAIRKA